MILPMKIKLFNPLIVSYRGPLQKRLAALTYIIPGVIGKNVIIIIMLGL
jgi:hypothetical protein